MPRNPNIGHPAPLFDNHPSSQGVIARYDDDQRSLWVEDEAEPVVEITSPDTEEIAEFLQYLHAPLMLHHELTIDEALQRGVKPKRLKRRNDFVKRSFGFEVEEEAEAGMLVAGLVPKLSDAYKKILESGQQHPEMTFDGLIPSKTYGMMLTPEDRALFEVYEVVSRVRQYVSNARSTASAVWSQVNTDPSANGVRFNPAVRTAIGEYIFSWHEMENYSWHPKTYRGLPNKQRIEKLEAINYGVRLLDDETLLRYCEKVRLTSRRRAVTLNIELDKADNHPLVADANELVEREYRREVQEAYDAYEPDEEYVG